MIKFSAPAEHVEPTVYLEVCFTGLTNYTVKEVRDRDLVGLRIRNNENIQDKLVGICFRRRDQQKPNVVWGVLGKVVQSNARFGLSDILQVLSDHVTMHAGNGTTSEKTKGRSLDVVSSIKKSIVKVKAGFLCLAHALIIAMSRVNGDPKYKSYRDGKALKQPVQNLLSGSGVDLNRARLQGTWTVSKLSFGL